jgi:hypothetical protein
MPAVKLTPITAFIAWSLLLTLAAGVHEHLLPPSDRRGFLFWDGMIVANALVVGALVVWELRHRRRAREAATAPPGRCPSCGRDMRPSETCCPECATTVATAAPSRDR